VANFPARGIGARSLEALQDAAKPVIRASTRRPQDFPEKAARGCLVRASHRIAQGGNAGVAFARDGRGDARKKRARRALPGRKRRRDRVENLSELVNAAAAFVNEGEEHDLPGFLAHAALESGENQAAEGTDALQLMTVHSAKGLEFHAVFITGLEEGLFPHEQSVLEDDGLEEERRLMYVAITRPTRLSYPSRKRACCTGRPATTSPRASSMSFRRKS